MPYNKNSERNLSNKKKTHGKAPITWVSWYSFHATHLVHHSFLQIPRDDQRHFVPQQNCNHRSAGFLSNSYEKGNAKSHRFHNQVHNENVTEEFLYLFFFFFFLNYNFFFFLIQYWQKHIWGILVLTLLSDQEHTWRSLKVLLKGGCHSDPWNKDTKL